MKLLFVNSCVREGSRTLDLARHLLELVSPGYEVEELELATMNLQGHSRESLVERDKLIAARDFTHPVFTLANQFASADLIVVAAPYWDLSFPALLKTYLENICVSGITFDYEGDKPVGLCQGKKLYYVTTAGGPIFCDFGYSYVEALCRNFFGIPEPLCIAAEKLDMISREEVEEELERVKFGMKTLV